MTLTRIKFYSRDIKLQERDVARGKSIRDGSTIVVVAAAGFLSLSEWSVTTCFT